MSCPLAPPSVSSERTRILGTAGRLPVFIVPPGIAPPGQNCLGSRWGSNFLAQHTTPAPRQDRRGETRHCTRAPAVKRCLEEAGEPCRRRGYGVGSFQSVSHPRSFADHSAMAMRITDHIWTIGGLIRVAGNPEPPAPRFRPFIYDDFGRLDPKHIKAGATPDLLAEFPMLTWYPRATSAPISVKRSSRLRKFPAKLPCRPESSRAPQ